MMTIDELLTQLTDLSLTLEVSPDDASTFDLQILIRQLRKQVVAQAFAPLTTLANSPVEVEQLKLLMPQVNQAIQTEQNRARLVARIVSLAKIALRATGVNLAGN
ncbi:MAG TPA: hypothetical protein VNH18_14910 [Bryobacteraceae bacterium]|nr:hypothetical protein [Bryobacteraceae bacterium]